MLKMKHLLILLFNFVKSPDYSADSNQKIFHKFKWLFLLLVLDAILTLLVVLIQRIPVAMGFNFPHKDELTRFYFSQEINPLIIAFVTIIFAPFIEELIFRLPLRIKRNNFIPFIFIGILFVGLSIIHKYFGSVMILYLIPLFLFGIAFTLNFNKKSFQSISHLFKSNYKVYFYSFTILFALIHIANYKFSWQIVFFAPLLVLPQFIGGFLMGFMRIRFGLLWGFFLHALHNTIYVLPIIFVMHKTAPKFIDKIDKDNYSIEIHEGYAFQKENGIILENKNSSTHKITPNEIILYGGLKNIISKLLKMQKNRIEFHNQFIAGKTVSIYFKTDSAHQLRNSKLGMQLVLENLLATCNLTMNKEMRNAVIWKLDISDKKLFNSHISDSATKLGTKTTRIFFGEKDTLVLNDINSQLLAKTLWTNFNVNIESTIDKYIYFSIKIPNGNRRELNKYLKTNYGIQITEKKRKQEFVVIK